MKLNLRTFFIPTLEPEVRHENDIRSFAGGQPQGRKKPIVTLSIDTTRANALYTATSNDDTVK